MMYRFIALLWNDADGDAAMAARFIASQLPETSSHQWRKSYATDGLTVFDAGAQAGRMQTCRLQNDSGVVLGKVFRNAPNGEYVSQTDDLDDIQSRKILRTQTGHLVTHYWGRYVAFLNDRATGVKYIMRDPSGAFPCFFTQHKGVEIYFSDMADVANFDFLPFTANHNYLATNILLPQFQKVHTGLNEVSEVLPAECVEIMPSGRTSRFVWNPTKIAETDVVENPEEAAMLLRKTVKNTVAALAGCYDSVVHNLGGIDSSIVLSALAATPKRPEITCINFYTESPAGEERFYSRQVAVKYGVPLVEKKLDYRKADLSRVFHSNKLANPLGFFDCLGLTNHLLNLAREKNAQALFYGVGGDNVFYQPPFSLGAQDYIHYHGFGRHAPRVMMEAARYGRQSIAKTFRAMVQERFSPAPCYRAVRDLMNGGVNHTLINPAFLSGHGGQKSLHPLLIPDDDMAKGKYLHILMCALFSIEHYDHWDPSYFAERIHVYLTQPVIEACLRIPTWVLTYNGVERGLARKAFEHELPQDVVMRFSKSTPVEFYNDIYAHNTDLLREILLDGILVQEKILLRDVLERTLSQEDVFFAVSPLEILGHFATEVWLRGWRDRPVADATSLKVAV